MRYVIRILDKSGFAYEDTPDLFGKYVAAYDPDANNGDGAVQTTDDPAAGVIFAKSGDAMLFYKQRSTVKPKRADGFPNCPLMMYRVEIEPLPMQARLQVRQEGKDQP